MQKMRLLTFMQMAEDRQEIYFDTIQQEMNLAADDIEEYIIDGETGQSVMLHCNNVSISQFS